MTGAWFCRDIGRQRGSAVERGKRLAKRPAPLVGEMPTPTAAAAAVIGYAQRLTLHYEQLTTTKGRHISQRRIDEALAYLDWLYRELGEDDTPELLEELHDFANSIAEHIAVVGAIAATMVRTAERACVIGFDERARIRRDRGYIGQAGPPPRAPQNAFGPSEQGAETRLSAADFRRRSKPSENNPPRKIFQPGIFGNGFVCPRGRRR